MLNFQRIVLSIIVLELIVLVSCDKKQDDSIQTCSKDDEICKNAAKVKESVDSKEKVSSGSPGADKSSKSTAETKTANKSDTKAKPKSKLNVKEDKIADCPLCAYTRPLIRNIMDWIKELLTDPMLLMIFNAFKDKIWELGQMTKQLLGIRLF